MAVRKQSLQHEDFVRLRAAARLVPAGYLRRKTEQAADLIRRHTAGRAAAYGWSGGKDSIALRIVAEMAGVHECVLGMSNLEYPAFLCWITDHMPEHLHVINTGLDLDWLARNPKMLFPQDSETAAKWFASVQHAAQARFWRERQMEVLILSILEDGWTQPIVILPANDDGSHDIVDGFHRYTVSADPRLMERFGGYVPTVTVALDPVHRRMSTIRHNRARGTHGIVPMAHIVRDIAAEVSPEEIQRRLGMEDEEVARLTDRAGMPEQAGRTRQAFGKSWVPGEKA